MRIALVRGPQLSPYEMQTYLPLAQRGHELVAFSSMRGNHELPPELKVVRLPSAHDGVAASRGLVRRAREALAYRTGRISRLEGLEDALAGFDVVHSMETFNAFTGQALDAAHARKRPLVVTVWENIPFLPVEPKLDAVRRRVVREADAFVAVTERAKAALLIEGAPEERVHVIPVGIDQARFRPAPDREAQRAARGYSPDDVVLLFAARLVWEKGLLDALHAMKLVQRRARVRMPRLLVVGDGEQRALAEARVRELGLGGYVTFLGAVPYPEMPKHYAVADALLLGSVPTPRWQEQYGMVLVEAMASGLAVVAGASGSVPEVVGDAGILVQPADAMDMAAAIERVCDAAQRRAMIDAGLERARRLYDREQVAAQIEALYRALA